MKELYNKFFRVPKYKRICDRVMRARVTLTLTVVIMCLAAMSISAYTYFSYNITSGPNIIKAAQFEAKASIQITQKNGETVEINPITGNYQTHKAELEAGSYIVEIAPTENSTAKTGFVVITADGCKETYHTQQLGIDETAPNGKTSFIKFELTITDKTCVYFLAHWGTSSHYDTYKNKGEENELYIIDNDKIKMIVNNIVDVPKSNETDNEETLPEDKTEKTDTTAPSENAEDTADREDRQTEIATEVENTTTAPEDQSASAAVIGGTVVAGSEITGTSTIEESE